MDRGEGQEGKKKRDGKKWKDWSVAEKEEWTT